MDFKTEQELLSADDDQLRNHNKDVITGKRKFNKKMVFSILSGPILAAMALFIYASISKSADHAIESKTVSWILFGIFVPLLIISLFAMQKYELVGAYGETIILLIPTFVWLLPTHNEAIWWITVVAFIISMVSLVLLIVSLIYLFKHTKKSEEVRKIVVTTLILRLMFITAAIAATLLVSILLIWWGSNSLDLLGNVGFGDKTSSNTEWILFVAVVSIVVASILIALGLMVRFQKLRRIYTDETKSVKTPDEILKHTHEVNVSTLNKVKKKAKK